jgi:ubiquitin carboxyl-terminal hydrolase 7
MHHNLPTRTKLLLVGFAATISTGGLAMLLRSTSKPQITLSDKQVLEEEEEEQNIPTQINGLNNLGATCYMNALLQALFHLRVLRKSLWNVQTNNPIICALQSLFYHLQFDYSPVSTQELVDSFGWSRSDAYVQHDVQELARLFIDKIESVLVSKKQDIISKLFKGVTENYINCLHVKYQSTRQEDFYDLQLNVTSNIYHSFRQYVKMDLLHGDNQYYAGKEFGHQDASRGIRFISFPPVLFIHLKRFEMTPMGSMNKINSRCEFPDNMNLSEFIAEANGTTDSQFEYTLQSVLIHSGNVSGGHYTCISNVSNNPDAKQWILFDDEHTKQITYSDVFEPNFGGLSSKSAYMLVYVQRDLFPHVMCHVGKSMIKPKIIERIEKTNSSCNIL